MTCSKAFLKELDGCRQLRFPRGGIHMYEDPGVGSGFWQEHHNFRFSSAISKLRSAGEHATSAEDELEHRVQDFANDLANYADRLEAELRNWKREVDPLVIGSFAGDLASLVFEQSALTKEAEDALERLNQAEVEQLREHILEPAKRDANRFVPSPESVNMQSHDTAPEQPKVIKYLKSVAGLYADMSKYAQAANQYWAEWNAEARRVTSKHSEPLIQKGHMLKFELNLQNESALACVGGYENQGLFLETLHGDLEPRPRSYHPFMSLQAAVGEFCRLASQRDSTRHEPTQHGLSEMIRLQQLDNLMRANDRFLEAFRQDCAAANAQDYNLPPMRLGRY